jgi:hypothetical protein
MTPIYGGLRRVPTFIAPRARVRRVTGRPSVTLRTTARAMVDLRFAHPRCVDCDTELLPDTPYGFVDRWHQP